MLHLSFLLGFIAICVALTINRAWTQANIGTVALGVGCVVVGNGREALF